MASIKETGKELNELEKKIRAYQHTLSELRKSSSDMGDATSSKEFERVSQKIDTLTGRIKTLKLELSGIGASGKGLGNIDAQIESMKANIDKSIVSVEKVAGKFSSVTVPTTFSSDSTAKQWSDLAKGMQEKRKAEEAEEAKALAQQKKIEAAQLASLNKVKAAQEKAMQGVQDKLGGVSQRIQMVSSLINNTVNKVVGIIRSAVNIVNKVLRTVSTTILNIGRGVTGLIKLLGNLGNRVRDSLSGGNSGKETVTMFGLISNSATELRSKLLLLKGTFTTVFNGDMIKRAKDLMSSIYSLSNIAGSGVTQEVIDWANGMERLLGISARELIADMNELTGVLYGLGMSGKDVAIGAENILMMSRYLSFMGAAGGDTEAVMNKLVSGMKGMTSSIDDLGLSVRDSQMDTFLKSLKAQGGEYANIATDFSSLNEQARVYVRYASLIDQFTKNYDITNMVDALGTVTGRLSVMQQSWGSLLTTIGTGLTKLLASFTSVLIPVIKWVETLITKLFALVGIDVSINVDMNQGNTGVGELNSGLGETQEKLDGISDSAKKAKGNLQGFDRVNNVTTQSGANKGAGAGSGFDYASLMSSMLGDLNKMALEASESYADKLTNQLKDRLKTMGEMFNEFAKDLTGREDFDLGFDWQKIKKNLTNVLQNIAHILKSWGMFVIEIGLKVADDLNVGAIITELTGLMSAISDLAVAMTDSLIPAFDRFYDVALSRIVTYIGGAVLKTIQVVITELERWSNWFKANDELILRFFESFGEVVSSVWGVLEPRLDALGALIESKFYAVGELARNGLTLGMESFNGDQSKFTQWIESELPGKLDKAIGMAKEFWDAISGNQSGESKAEHEGTVWGNILGILTSVNSIANSLLPIVTELTSAFGKWAGEEFLPYLNESLKKLSSWIESNKTDVTNLLKELGNTAWDSFKVFVDLVSQLIGFIVENPDAVANFFKTLVGLKVASWAGDTVVSLGDLVGAITKLSGATGAGAGASGILGGLAVGPIVAVAAAVALLAGVMTNLWKNSEKFKEVFTKLGDDIGNSLGKVREAFSGSGEDGGGVFDKLSKSFDALSKSLEPVITLIGVLSGGIITGLLNTLAPLAEFLGTTLASAITVVAGLVDVLVGALTLDGDKIAQGFGKIGEGILNFVLSIPGLIGGAIDGVISAIASTVDSLGIAFVDGFEGGIEEAWSGFSAFLDEKWQSIVKGIKEFFGIHSPSTVFAEIGGFLVAGMWEGIQSAWSGFTENVKEVCGKVLTEIKNVFNGLGEWFGETFTKARDSALGAWSDIQDRFKVISDNVIKVFSNFNSEAEKTFLAGKNAAIGVWGNAKSEFEKVANNAASGLSAFKTKSDEIFKSVVTSAGNIFSGLGSLIGSKIGSITSKINTEYTDMSNRVAPVKASKIKAYANGGSIAGGQLFIANEGGNAELIGNISGSTGGTDVANQEMIMTSMTDGIREAVYNALADIDEQRGAGRVGAGQDIKVEVNGFGIMTESTLRQFASILAPYMAATNTNIANTQASAI